VRSGPGSGAETSDGPEALSGVEARLAAARAYKEAQKAREGTDGAAAGASRDASAATFEPPKPPPAPEGGAVIGQGGNDDAKLKAKEQALLAALGQRPAKPAAPAGAPPPPERAEARVEAAKNAPKEVVFETKSGDYNPTISTWGVFPRPSNISKAYGGGRTIRKEELDEPNEEREARLQRVRANLTQYKENMGLLVDPEVEAEANARLESGTELLVTGKLKLAMSEFEAVLDLVSINTEVGGMAQLNLGICLDSLGRNDEGCNKYKTLVRHPNGSVAKKARQLLDSFESMKWLKANTISFASGSEEWKPYFEVGDVREKLVYTRDTASESTKALNRQALAASLAVVLFPGALFFALTVK